MILRIYKKNITLLLEHVMILCSCIKTYSQMAFFSIFLEAREACDKMF